MSRKPFVMENLNEFLMVNTICHDSEKLEVKMESRNIFLDMAVVLIFIVSMWFFIYFTAVAGLINWWG